MRLALVTAFTAVLFSLAAASCGAAKTCTPQSCASGCCSDSGECLSGGENSACGTNGNTCVNCAATAQLCGDKACIAAGTGGGGGTDGGTGGGTGGGDGGAEFCTRTPVECSDQAIQGLDLKSSLATGAITNTAEGTGWRSTIDSRGGGFPPSQSYVYARFTDTGMSVVPLDDLTALDSMDWDIAFRRFVVRINSGDSGPACVSAAMLPTSTLYDTVTTLPAGLTFEGDDFLDRPPGCVFIDDGSGLTSSPRTYLSTYYQYTNCVAMTKQVFVIRAGNTRHVKFTVDTYYATQAGQDLCDSTGSSGGVAGGTMRVRWAWLD